MARHASENIHKKAQMKKMLLTLTLTLPAWAFTFAQEQALPCGLVQATQELRAKHPGLYELEQQLAQENRGQEDEGSERAVKIIPVVVHILHNYGTENISDAQVYDAIRILNEDFQGLQPDTANIAPAFKSRQGNPNFEFRLARKDPDGNCTNGITRTATTHTYNANEDAKTIAPIWPRNKYMNVWVVQKLENGAGGYTYTPGTASFMPANDGIILVNRQFGGIGTSFGGLLSKRTLSHETGHWFNLQHTWGGNNNPGVSCGSDDVDDTPQTMGVADQSCNIAQVSCGNLNNIQNIMDYSSCPIMFTAGQSARMTTASNSTTAQRSSLWTASNLLATGVSDGFSDTLCKPVADFKSATRLACVGTPVTFTDLSYNGVVNSRSWTFTNTTDGSTVINSALQNPQITFNVPGLYNVSLTVTNARGNGVIVKTDYVRVYAAGAQFSNNGYSENFEGDISAAGWFSVNDAPTFGWQVTTAAAVSGTKSMTVRNFFGDGTETYNLYSPSYDLSLISQPKLRFKYAYADKVTANDDRLRVYATSNCGTSWFQLSPPITNTALVTAPAQQNSSFVPTASQWTEKEFTIPASVSTATSVRFRFEFTSNGGNNLYLDDINIPASLSVADAEVSGMGWEVFPNPADDYVDIRITGNGDKEVADNLLVCDASGRVIQTISLKGNAPLLRADISGLAAGVYFIRSQKGLLAGTKKIIVR